METTLALLGAIASILAVLLAFYTIFINGRAIRRMLAKQDERLAKQDERLAKQGEMIERLALLISEESRLTREVIAKISEQIERIPEKTAFLLQKG